MKVNRILLALLVLPSLAFADSGANPDGAVGTMWLDVGSSLGVSGKWTTDFAAGAPEETEGDSRVGSYRADLGVVVSPAVTLSFGVGVETLNERKFYGLYFNDVRVADIDYKHNALSARVALRVYVRRPGSVG